MDTETRGQSPIDEAAAAQVRDIPSAEEADEEDEEVVKTTTADLNPPPPMTAGDSLQDGAAAADADQTAEEDANADTASKAAPQGHKSLWDALNLPEPDTAKSDSVVRRVVLVGVPSSGKRTLCRALALAAEASRTDRDTEQSAPHTNTADRQPLYNPGPDDSSSDEEQVTVFMRSALPKFTRRTAGAGGHAQHAETHPHGVGIAHDYVLQRVSRAGGGNFGVTRRVTEFYCCDNGGALFMALPTVASLREAVVLVVVDVSQPTSAIDQVSYSYGLLRKHVASILRTYLPEQDEVRRLQLQEEVAAFWTAEERHATETRERLWGETGFCANSATTASASAVASAVQAAEQQESACPLRSIMVCTKTDVMDRLSALLTPDTLRSALLSETDANVLEGVVPQQVSTLCEQTGQSLALVVQQVLRYLAQLELSGFAATNSTIAPTNTSGSDAMIHPFFRSLWSYISFLLYDHQNATEEEEEALLPQTYLDAQRSISNSAHCGFCPSSFFPIGLDSADFLDPVIPSLIEAVNTMRGNRASRVPDSTVDEYANPFADGAVFKLHQFYLSEMNA